MSKLHPKEIAQRLQNWDKELELPAGSETKEVTEHKKRMRNRGKRTPFGFIREDRLHPLNPKQEEGEE